MQSIQRQSDDPSVDDEEYDLDYIRSCKPLCFFRRDKNGDPAIVGKM